MTYSYNYQYQYQSIYISPYPSHPHSLLDILLQKLNNHHLILNPNPAPQIIRKHNSTAQLLRNPTTEILALGLVLIGTDV